MSSFDQPGNRGSPAFIVFIMRMYFILSAPRLQALRFPAVHDLPHLNRHIRRHTTRPGRTRDLSSDLTGAFYSLHINNPITCKEFLSFHENTVRNGRTVCTGPDELSLFRPR